MVTPWHEICANCLQGGSRHFTGMERVFLELLQPVKSVPFQRGCHLLILSPWACPVLPYCGWMCYFQGAVATGGGCRHVSAPTWLKCDTSCWYECVSRKGYFLKQHKSICVRVISQSCRLSWLLPIIALLEGSLPASFAPRNEAEHPARLIEPGSPMEDEQILISGSETFCQHPQLI